jgi:hypothetical protein
MEAKVCEFSKFYIAIKEPSERTRAHLNQDSCSAPFNNDLTKLATALTKDRRVKHFQNLNWRRPFLSKSRYMCGRQCSKKLWQTVYDPEPVQEPLPGTVKGMGIEVGIKARLLWPGGVLIDTLDSAEAIRRTKSLIADSSAPAIFEAALGLMVCWFELMHSNGSPMAAGG